MDRMRESVFSILGPLAGLSFCDIFSGSGIIALEAASRGAFPVVSVEGDRGKRRILEKNAGIVPGVVDVSIMPAERFISAWRKSYDIIFLDPPFPYRYKDQLLLRLGVSRLVHPGTRILIHFPEGDNIPEFLPARVAPVNAGAPDISAAPDNAAAPRFAVSPGRNVADNHQDPTPDQPQSGAETFRSSEGEPPGFRVVDRRSYGRSQVWIFAQSAGTSAGASSNEKGKHEV